MSKKQIKFFQDLPSDMQIEIFAGIRDMLVEEGLVDDELTDAEIDNQTEDYINRENTPENVKEWIEEYYL